MPFDLPSFDEMRALLIAAMGGRFPNANLSQRSDLYKRLSVTALGCVDTHYHIYQVGLDVMPDTAEGEYLTRHGVIYGVTRRGATGGAKSAGLRVFGASGASVPNNEPLYHAASGLEFETRSSGTIPAAGYLDVDVAATSTGAVTNLEVDQELQFQTTPTDLEDNARIVLELEDGQDEENDDALRARILDRIQQPAAGGTRNDYEEFCLEAAAYVATAYVYANRNGAGTVDLACLKLGSGTVRLLDAGERSTVLNYVDGVRPVSATCRVLEVTTSETDVEIKITPESDPAYLRDWNDGTPPTVSTWVAGTRTLTFNADRPVDMAVGDRLIVDSSTGDGAQAVIEALSSTDAVVLTEALAFTPSASDPVYSGGPMTATIRNAVIALFDALGPANPAAAGYGAPHEGSLRLSTLFEVVQTQAGVLDSEIVDPSANVDADDPAWPDNDSIELLIPGKILIRYA